MARVNMGRRKIQMKRIPSEKARQVAFSKRRSSLFKKANELCILTGAEVAVLVFSPGGKPFSFGDPSVNAVTSRLFNGRRLPDSNYQDPRGAAISSLYQQYNVLRKRAEAEKKRGVELSRIWAQRRMPCWLTQPIDELNLDQLRTLKAHLLNFRKKIAERVKELLGKASTSTGLIDLNVANPAEMEGSVYP